MVVCFSPSVFFFFAVCVWSVGFCFLFFVVLLPEVLQLPVCGAGVGVCEDGVGGGGGVCCFGGSGCGTVGGSRSGLIRDVMSVRLGISM